MLLLRITKGMGLVEVLIAIFLAAVAIMATFSMQAPSLKMAAQSDYVGRAAEILERQLESTECYIMNVNNKLANADSGIPALPLTVGAFTNAVYTVNTSNLAAAITGDTTYNVSTTITGAALDSLGNLSYRVDVNVAWSINKGGNISQTIFVSRQELFTAPI